MTTIIKLFTEQSEMSALRAERPDEICMKLILPGLNEKHLFTQNDFFFGNKASAKINALWSDPALNQSLFPSHRYLLIQRGINSLCATESMLHRACPISIPCREGPAAAEEGI